MASRHLQWKNQRYLSATPITMLINWATLVGDSRKTFAKADFIKTHIASIPKPFWPFLHPFVEDFIFQMLSYLQNNTPKMFINCYMLSRIKLIIANRDWALLQNQVFFQKIAPCFQLFVNLQAYYIHHSFRARHQAGLIIRNQAPPPRSAMKESSVSPRTMRNDCLVIIFVAKKDGVYRLGK